MSVHWGGPGAGHVSRWSVATTGVPVLSLDFLTSNFLDPRVTFTRSTTATFVGSNGLIQTAAINAPRFDYNPVTLAPNGLLIEEQRVNSLLYSDQFQQATWSKGSGSITADTILSPDGTTNADAFIENTAASAFHFVSQSITKAASNIAYAGSFYLKNKGRQVSFSLQNAAGSSGVVGRVNPATGTVTQNAIAFGTGFTAGTITMTDVGNGWYRVVLTATSDTSTSIVFQQVLHNGTTAVYTGDGVSGAFLWGAQLEAGAFATSYIPTVASTVTRAADIASMTGTNFSSWYNQSEGTIVSNTAIYSTFARNSAAYDINDTTSSNRTVYRTITTISNDQAVIRSGGSVSASLSTIAAVNTSPRKAAVAYKAADFALSANGSAVVTSTSGAVPVSVTQMQIGFAVGPGEWLNGHIRTLTYYPSRLSDAQLQALTA